jgi:phenylpyruvate tautomerase PptA (4-oxalocrotonate tautomerase family)
MPLISVKTSAAAGNSGAALLRELSTTLAELLGKPERYVMTLLEEGVPMTFSGSPEPTCYVEVKSIGALDGERPREVSQAVCALLERHLGVPADRIYIGFEDAPPRLWGWNGSTFG